MKKYIREAVYNKCGGHCAYCGQALREKDWQVDHVRPLRSFRTKKTKAEKGNHIDNLLPACRKCNHYKRALNLEGWRRFMQNFHIRLGKLPKKTRVEMMAKRIAYLNEVSVNFGVTVDMPFCGRFHFERVGDDTKYQE